MDYEAQFRTPSKKCRSSGFWRNRVTAVKGKRRLRKNHLAEVFEAKPVAFNQHSFGFTVVSGRKQPGEKLYRSLREFTRDVVGAFVGRSGVYYSLN